MTGFTRSVVTGWFIAVPILQQGRQRAKYSLHVVSGLSVHTMYVA